MDPDHNQNHLRPNFPLHLLDSSSSSSTSIFRRLLPYLLPYRRTIGFGLFLLLISIPASNFHPIVWAYIVDTVIGKHRIDTVAQGRSGNRELFVLQTRRQLGGLEVAQVLFDERFAFL